MGKLSLLLTAASLGQFLDGDFAAWLPKSPDPHLQRLKELASEDKLKFYRHESAFQLSDRNGLRLVRSEHQLTQFDLNGHPNFEFPWKHTAGLQSKEDPGEANWTTLTFVHLPGPIRYKEPGPELGSRFTWTYPAGTVFGELMFVIDAGNQGRVFEVRTRERQEGGNWVSRQFSPDADWRERQTGTKEIRIKGFRIDKVIKLGVLPAIDPAELDGMEFVEGANDFTTTEISVVPKHYLGAITDCATCHKQTGLSTRDIGRETGEARIWDGVVRGSDQVFSFSIFNPNSVGNNDAIRVVPSQRLIDAGLLVKE